MERNQDLRRRIAGQHRVIQVHDKKIRLEPLKPQPNEAYIEGWQREMEIARKRESRN